MLDLVATGYGRAALDALRRVVSRAKTGDPLAPVVVVVPNHVAGTVARRHLARHGLEGGAGPGIAGLEITTLARLAERLAASDLAPRRPATRQVVASAWRRALRTSPGVFAETAAHPATVRALVAAHRELRDLSPNALDQVAAAGRVSRDLVRLHRDVVTLLEPPWYDVTDLLEAATARAADVGASVVLYLPQDLGAAETRFVDALASVGDVVVLAGRTHVERADGGLPKRWQTPPLPAAAVATAHEVLNTSDSDDEVRCVVRDVVASLQETDADRIAVLYTADDPYAALLHDHLAAAGIRVNGTGSRPMSDRALPRAVLGLLALPEDDLSRSALFRILNGAPLRDFAGDPIPVAAWERASREAGVVRGADWRVRLDAYLERQRGALARAHDEDMEARAQAVQRQITAATELQGFVLRLRSELDAAARLKTWTELATWCQHLVTTLIGGPSTLTRLPQEEQYAATAITSLLTGLEVLDEIDPHASLRGLRDALDAELAEAVPRLGRFGEGVLVAPLSQAVGLDADVVHVVGLGEDLYPGRAGGDSLLPDSLRTAVPELRSVRERQGTAYRHLLAAFAAAPRAVASFPRGDLRSSSRRLPSRWLLGTLRELSGDHGLALSRWDRVGDLDGRLRTSPSFSAELLHTPDPATRQEWRARAATAGALEDGVVTAATDMLRARAGSVFTRFDGDLSGCEGLPDHRTGDPTLAPTALEQYVDCPHAFFVRRLLRVEPLDQPEDVVEVSPADIGNLVHRCVERLVTEDPEALPSFGAPWTAEQRTRLVQIAREEAAELERTGLTGHPRLWQRERDRIEVDLAAMLVADDEWRAEHDARVVASELAFGRAGEPPVGLPVPGGRVLLRGSIDKVDLGRDGTVYVTDIKTGRSNGYRGITAEDPLAGATRFQLPVYAIAARSRLDAPDASVRAEYWFVRRDPGRIGIDVDEQVLTTLAETVGSLVGFAAQGLYPPRPPVEADYSYVQCRYCNPDGLGHGAARERWERQRHDPALAGLLAVLEPDVAAEGEA